jgi:hypothetical protein
LLLGGSRRPRRLSQIHFGPPQKLKKTLFVICDENKKWLPEIQNMSSSENLNDSPGVECINVINVLIILDT